MTPENPRQTADVGRTAPNSPPMDPEPTETPNGRLSETCHGGRQRVSWSVTRNTSTQLFGDNEERARADYERRRKTLHRGETIRLERLVVAEAWVQRLDVMDETTKGRANEEADR